MSTQDKVIFQSDDIRKFYLHQLKEFGDSPQGVGWKNDAAQHIRFAQLAKVLSQKNFSLNDLGCGTGRLYDFLTDTHGSLVRYLGYDILDEMIDEAKKKFAGNPNVSLKRINSASEMESADYSICSGIFNVKYE